jgi:endonuclease I
MKKRILASLCLTALAMQSILAQGPNGTGTYYRNADGKSGKELKTAFHNIIAKKERNPGYDDLLELYKTTDTRADGKVRDWYSNITNFVHIKDKAGSYKKEGDVYNREHLVPQSWGAPKSDIVHVVPTDGYVNNKRGNLPLGEVGTPNYQSANSYSKSGSCKTPGYTGVVFEPNDEVRET